MFFQHCTLNMWAWRYNTNPWFKADQFNFPGNRIIDYFKQKWTINLYSAISLSLSIYLSYINIVWCISFAKADGEAKAKFPQHLWDLAIYIMGALKSGFCRKADSQYTDNRKPRNLFFWKTLCLVSIVFVHYWVIKFRYFW